MWQLMNEQDPKKLTAAVVRAAEQLGFAPEQLAKVLRLDLETIYRMLIGGYCLWKPLSEWQRGVLLSGIYVDLMEVVGDDPVAARYWISEPNNAFSRKSPAKITETQGGLELVAAYLEGQRRKI